MMEAGDEQSGMHSLGAISWPIYCNVKEWRNTCATRGCSVFSNSVLHEAPIILDVFNSDDDVSGNVIH